MKTSTTRSPAVVPGPRALVSLLASALVLSVGPCAVASAQDVSDPDIRNIRPVVMLLVDTSGSMERMSGGSGAALPICAGSPSGTNERNRWNQVVEALTGTWSDSDYFCSSVSRTAFTGDPDFNYYIPYHRPPLALSQANDGVLDVYIDRIKFGLMTFDGTYTFTDSHPLLVEELPFLARLSDNVTRPGGYSYGEAKPLRYDGCPTTFMVDSGVRGAGAPSGALISVGTEADDSRIVNQQIQEQLRTSRPYGGTPTAAMLDDLRYYLNHDPDVTAEDPYAECRSRYVLLLTDGVPDEDFRDARFNCEAVSGGCPYERSETIAGDLCRYSSSSGECQGLVDGVFVVAFDVENTDALAALDSIAAVGGTSAALQAADRAGLMGRISEALDRAAPGNTSRSTPAFVTGATATSGGGSPVQYQFNAGFHVGGDGEPWRGVLERTRYVCDDSTLTPSPEDPSLRIQFDEVLNANTTRRLLTVITPRASDMDGNLIGADADSVPLGATVPGSSVRGLSMSPFNASIGPEYFGYTSGSTTTRSNNRNAVVAWVHGDTRAEARMGDIYHSSPVAVGPPRVDIADDSYNLFRRMPGVADRPTVVYVGTNDGVLHAFSVEDWTSTEGDASYDAGEEIWGFIPPILMEKLPSAVASHQIMLDGTPVVRDIFYRRQPGDAPNGEIYHTVLIMGFRGGARGYFALDVTDPTDPVFLWQFVGDSRTGRGGSVVELGYSYGVPAIGQVLVDVGGVLQERAVALLPGGAGNVDGETSRTTGPVGCPAQGIGQPPVTDGTTNARSHQRCWNNTGRILTWVDMVTGEVIRTFDETVFNAPLSGGVALYPGDVGTIAQRAFLTDADGVMWTVDFSARTPSEWDVRPFHDIFWDADATVGQPAYAPPLVSIDAQGQIVVLQATGDIDRLDDSAANRVVSLTETVTYSDTGVPTFDTLLNWEVRLHPGEQVTGPLELFEGTAYFATFESAADLENACDIGQSRIWAMRYLESGATAPDGYTDPTGKFPQPGFERVPGSGIYDEHIRGPFLDRLVLGVGITQRPSCIQGDLVADPYMSSNRFRVSNVGGGTFTLTAMVSGGPADAAGGGAIQTISESLPTPESFTTMRSFAGQVDY